VAKEAIEAVKEAEAQAHAILQEATQASRDLMQTAEALAEDKYRQIMEEAEKEANAIKEQALSEGESIAKPIIEKGMQESQELAKMSNEDLDKTVNIIIERIVNVNGNS